MHHKLLIQNAISNLRELGCRLSVSPRGLTPRGRSVVSLGLWAIRECLRLARRVIRVGGSAPRGERNLRSSFGSVGNARHLMIRLAGRPTIAHGDSAPLQRWSSRTSWAATSCAVRLMVSNITGIACLISPR